MLMAIPPGVEDFQILITNLAFWAAVVLAGFGVIDVRWVGF